MRFGVNRYLVQVVTHYYYHDSSIFHRPQDTGSVITAYPNTHNEEKKKSLQAQLPPQNAKYRQTESSLCHYSTTESTGLFLSPDGEVFAATAASAFALRSSLNPCRLTSSLFRPGMRCCSFSGTRSAQLVWVTSWSASH